MSSLLVVHVSPSRPSATPIPQSQNLAPARFCNCLSLNVAQQIEMKLGDFFTDQVERIFEPQYVRVQEAINMGNAEAAQIAGDLRLIEGAQKELVAVASKLKV